MLSLHRLCQYSSIFVFQRAASTPASVIFLKRNFHHGRISHGNLCPSSRRVSSSLAPSSQIEKLSQRQSLWAKAKHMVSEFYDGSKLLFKETRISARLLMKMLRGQELIRREEMQLTRTSKDLLRLVPFVIIVTIPFLEFALPVIIRFFPNFLPSTFESALQRENLVKKQLKVKLEMAKFIRDMAQVQSIDDAVIKRCNEVTEKIRQNNDSLKQEAVKEAFEALQSKFEFESLTRSNLQKICKYMHLSTIAPDNFLRNSLKREFRAIRSDDKKILKEGVHSLSLSELRDACHKRGIYSLDVTEEFMRRELATWIQLHVVHKVPMHVLILQQVLGLASDFKSSASNREKLAQLAEEEQLISTELQDQAESKAAVAAAATVQDMSQSVADVASGNLASAEIDELANLLKDRERLSASDHTSGSTSSKLDQQLEKLLKDIDTSIKNLSEQINHRLDLVKASEDGSITTEQLEAILQLLSNSPKDAIQIQNAIRAFDADGDGKVFVKDLLKVAQKAKRDEVQNPRNNE